MGTLKEDVLNAVVARGNLCIIQAFTLILISLMTHKTPLELDSKGVLLCQPNSKVPCNSDPNNRAKALVTLGRLLSNCGCKVNFPGC